MAAVANESEKEIYLGFEKTDTAPRAGRKGRVVKDDPRKYPGREDMGFFLGVVGGWAGGEAALAKLKDEAEVRSARLIERGACAHACRHALEPGPRAAESVARAAPRPLAPAAAGAGAGDLL